jgi:hypothetical protein
MIGFFVVEPPLTTTLRFHGGSGACKLIGRFLRFFCQKGEVFNMCSERDLRSALREGPVDRKGVCYCSVPEAVQVLIKKIQILSFDESTGVGSAAENIVPIHTLFHCDEMAA